MKKLLKRLSFGKPLLMSVYQDKYGDKYGGTIHKEGENVIDITSHIKQPVWLGKIEIY